LHTWRARREGKKWKSDGRISGDTVTMFDITGRLRTGYSTTEAVIDWTYARSTFAAYSSPASHNAQHATQHVHIQRP
jgi:hypothetical protein